MIVSPDVQARNLIYKKVKSCMVKAIEAYFKAQYGMISPIQYMSDIDNIAIETYKDVSKSIFVIRTEPSMN